MAQTSISTTGYRCNIGIKPVLRRKHRLELRLQKMESTSIQYCCDTKSFNNCCSACHEDDYFGYNQLLEFESKNKEITFIGCCKFGDYLKDKDLIS